MSIFFEIIRFFFFFVTILIGLFFFRGQLMFSDDQFLLIQKVAMPGYMILCGIMIGYLIGTVRLSRYEEPKEKINHIYAMSLVFGLIIGIILALINIFYVI